MRMLQLREQLSAIKWAEHRNAAWIFSERILNSGLNFISIIAITRLLGPLDYGHWAFALSVTGILLATGHLGLDGLLIKRIVESPEAVAKLLGTVVALKTAVYLPSIAGVLLFFHGREGLTSEEQRLLLILMVPVVTAPLTSTMLAWTNAGSLFGGTALVRISANVVGTAGKLAAILGGFGIIAVGYAHASMFLLELLLLLVLVRLHGGPLPWSWRVDWREAKLLLGQSLFLYAATIFAILYFNVDIMSMRAFFGPLEVGRYALVPQLIQTVQLIPYAVTLASFPTLVALSRQGEAEFRARALRLVWQLVILALLTSASLVAFAFLGFERIFGSEFRETISVLAIGSLSIPFLFVRQLTTKIFILKNRGAALVMIELAGAILSVVLSIVFVPLFGARGAVSVFAFVCAFTVLASLRLLARGRVLAPLATP